jgi:hypothetical protein
MARRAIRPPSETTLGTRSNSYRMVRRNSNRLGLAPRRTRADLVDRPPCLTESNVPSQKLSDPTRVFLVNLRELALGDEFWVEFDIVALAKQVGTARRQHTAWQQVIDERTQAPPIDYLNPALVIKKHIPRSEITVDKLILPGPNGEFNQLSFHDGGVRRLVQVPEQVPVRRL